jgi:SAM-dependent methyltransferase
VDREYYQQYRDLELNHWWFRGREKILRELLEIIVYQRFTDSIKILNVGAATGRSSEWLSEFGEVESIEYDPECAAMAEEFTGMPITVGSATELPFEDDQFDLVTAFDVIEHIEDDQAAANELVRVCRPGGIVFVTVPAFQFLWSQHDEINHHFRRYGRGELKQLFPKMERRLESYFNTWMFPAIAAVRLLSGLKGRSDQEPAESDFSRANPGFLDAVLRRVFQSERFFLKRGIPLPVGVSELLVMEKRTERLEPS